MYSLFMKMFMWVCGCIIIFGASYMFSSLWISYFRDEKKGVDFSPICPAVLVTFVFILASWPILFE